jgi:hypothetical protein
VSITGPHRAGSSSSAHASEASSPSKLSHLANSPSNVNSCYIYSCASLGARSPNSPGYHGEHLVAIAGAFFWVEKRPPRAVYLLHVSGRFARNDLFEQETNHVRELADPVLPLCQVPCRMVPATARRGTIDLSLRGRSRRLRLIFSAPRLSPATPQYSSAV